MDIDDLTEPSAHISVQRLEHISQWSRLLSLRNPSSGESKVEAGNAASSRQLQELLGKHARGAKSSSEGGTSASLLVPSSSQPRSDVQPSKPTGGRVVERAPTRDPVGISELRRSAAASPFKGILDLPPKEMKEAGGWRVECPECATMRRLNPLRKTVRFPPHEKRKTRTPSSEERWVMQRTVWKLASQVSGT